MFARFDGISSMTLLDIKETVYTIHQELQRKITPKVLAPSPYFLLLVFVLKVGMCLQGLMKFHQ